MSYRAVRLWGIVCLVCLMLGGCKDNTTPKVTANYESELLFGVFEAEKLKVLPWNSGRSESTTAHRVAEVESGYYFLYDLYLYYADKTDLTNWVLVCGKPNCEHYKYNENTGYVDLMEDCYAQMDGEWIVWQDGRLYYTEYRGNFDVPIKSKGMGNLIVSVAPNGADKKFAYAIEDALILSEGIAGGRLIGDQWIQSKSEIDVDGNTVSRMFVLDKEGEREIEIPSDAKIEIYACHDFFLCGDPYFECNGISSTKLLTIQNGELFGFDKKYVPETGGYISGTTLRIFKEDKGYFDIDVTTGKQVKVADNRLKDSTGMILAPNCVVESTLFSFNRKNRTEAGAIEVFDGESWRSVQLPKEWQNPGSDHWLHILGITSDSIWLYGRNEEDFYGGWGFPSDLYRIPLDKEELVMEYCFTFPISPQ